MSDPKDSLGDRMKGNYEVRAQTWIPRRMPMILRLDGVAFHTLTRGFNKPWDEYMASSMTEAAMAVFRMIQGAKLAYVQSDEISVLVTDYDTLQTQAWFDRNVQKMVSVSASAATLAFNRTLTSHHDQRWFYAHFDCRAFALPKEEVNNYFLWRQNDAVRNSIQGLAQSKFSHGSLQGLNCNQLQEKLFQDAHINWNDTPTKYKRGWCIRRANGLDGEVLVDTEIPIFSLKPDYVNHLLIPKET